MKDLSVTQEFLMCSLNEKGKLPMNRNIISACIIAGALIELLQNEDIKMEGTNVIAIKDSKSDLSYLSSLMSEIKEQDTIEIKKLMSKYVLGINDKKINLLISELGNELSNKECVIKANNGIFVNKVSYIPNKKCTDNIIEKIRAELLEDGPVTEETIALVVLLDKSNILKKYFSQYESKKLKERLKEIRNTSQNQLVNQMVECVDTMVAIMTVIISSTAIN